MTYQALQTTSNFIPTAGVIILAATTMFSDNAYSPTETAFSKDYFIDEPNQVKTLWDAPMVENRTDLYDRFSPNTLQENHATSTDMCEQIMAGIDRQLLLAVEEARDITVSKPSKTSLFEFAKMHKITRAPFVILRDNGNLSASWKYENGNKFKLIFLKDGSLNYVAFLNRPEKRATLHGNDTIMGVMNFIQSNEIIL